MPLTRRLLVCALAGLALSACLSPTLPMPPPAPPDVQRVGQGQYELSGQLYDQGDLVLALNVRTGEVTGQLAKPSYRFVVSAEPGDSMSLWYVDGLRSSEATEFEIPLTTIGDAGTD